MESDYLCLHWRIYRLKMFQACMSCLKLFMQYHWGTLAFYLSWSILINWVQDPGMYLNQLAMSLPFFSNWIVCQISYSIEHCIFIVLSTYFVSWCKFQNALVCVAFSSFFASWILAVGVKSFGNCWEFQSMLNNCRHLHLIQRIVPEIRNYFAKALTKPNT